MKKEFHTQPEFLKDTQLYGFSWEEHVAAIPAPLMVVTSYKANGKPNATLQSWTTFTSEQGFFCILASVNKGQHMYQSVKQTGQLVLNFMSEDIYSKCHESIIHNHDEDDEITMSGLTAEPATMVKAPRIKECFLNLECEYVWEKDITEGDYRTVMCVKIINVCMDEDYYTVSKLGRYDKTGFLYNVHSPLNPDSGLREKDALATLSILREA